MFTDGGLVARVRSVPLAGEAVGFYRFLAGHVSFEFHTCFDSFSQTGKTTFVGCGYVESHVGGHAIFLDPTTIPVETTEHIHSIEIAARRRNLELCSCLKIICRNAIASPRLL